MAKKPKPLVSVSQADLKKMTRSEQRRFVQLGYVEGVDAQPAPEGAKAKAG